MQTDILDRLDERQEGRELASLVAELRGTRAPLRGDSADDAQRQGKASRRRRRRRIALAIAVVVAVALSALHLVISAGSKFRAAAVGSIPDPDPGREPIPAAAYPSPADPWWPPDNGATNARVPVVREGGAARYRVAVAIAVAIVLGLAVAAITVLAFRIRLTRKKSPGRVPTRTPRAPDSPSGEKRMDVAAEGDALVNRRSIIDIDSATVVSAEQGITTTVAPPPATGDAGSDPDAQWAGIAAEVGLESVRLKRCLGRGAQGVVYLGEIVDTGLPVAVKIVQTPSRDTRSNAMREALLCARLHHRHIVRVYHVEPCDDWVVLVMEWVKGSHVDHGNPPGETERRACLKQLASAIQALRAARVVHRDVKPANVLVRRSDQSAVLVDFGLAFDLQTGNFGKRQVSGTPLFMPPETLRGQPPDEGTDPYALGIMALWLYCENFPKQARGIGFPALMQAKQNGTFASHMQRHLDGVRSLRIRRWIRGLISNSKRTRLRALTVSERVLSATT